MRAQAAGEGTLQLPVEHVGRVSGFPSLTQITVRLADGMSANRDFQVSVTQRGVTSNRVTLAIR